MKKMIKIVIAILLIVFAVCLVILYYFLVGKVPQQKDITWGVNFSQKQAESLNLDWKKAYLAILDDLNVKKIKLLPGWDSIAKESGKYDFIDIDWQLEEAEKRDAKIIYVVGIKTGRWPECHIPIWTESLAKEEQQKEALNYVREVILRYKDKKSIVSWQVENEPFFYFGSCPSWYYKDKEFIKKEIALVKSIDAIRPIIISDTGEQSLWLKAAKNGDIVGITMYRNIWATIYKDFSFYFESYLTPFFYHRRAEIVKLFYGKEVICGELQAEPWTHKNFMSTPLLEQEKTMNLNQFKKNIEFAKNTGIKEFYLWGAEWWYWLKTTQGKPEIWNESKNLFN
jgi:hypothetical protein